MSKEFDRDDSIKITKYAFNKILSWSQATTEIVFLTTGKGNEITNAIRLKNVSDEPTDYFEYCDKEEKRVRKLVKYTGDEIICMGHSHPCDSHLRTPSKSDWKYLPRNSKQLIVFPNEAKLGVWNFRKTYALTLLSECSIEVVN